MLYQWTVRALKIPRVNLWWRQYRAWRGETVGNYNHLPDYIRRHAPGKSFADIGCMWGVNGDYAFLAEQSGATRVVAVDVFGPTPEFEQKRAALGSSVAFVLGDVSRIVLQPVRLEHVLCLFNGHDDPLLKVLGTGDRERGPGPGISRDGGCLTVCGRRWSQVFHLDGALGDCVDALVLIRA